MDDVYLSSFSDEKQCGKITQALIDRTLFIKFLEDKKIINSDFYQTNFGDKNIYYKNLLEQKDARQINKLFLEINKTFNNKLFETPEIKDSDLLDNALIEIANAIKGTGHDRQLSLFDFQFDFIPIEFISHIYQIFLDDEKKEKGIFYTPESLAKLVVENVIGKRQAGTVLDPSCGSGIFHRIKSWEGNNTQYGFVMNSSNFQNDSDKFSKFFFTNFSLLQFYELTKVKKILFEFAKEPACVVIFRKKNKFRNISIYCAGIE